MAASIGPVFSPFERTARVTCGRACTILVDLELDIVVAIGYGRARGGVESSLKIELLINPTNSRGRDGPKRGIGKNYHADKA